jgi:hypothetical protein
VDNPDEVSVKHLEGRGTIKIFDPCQDQLYDDQHEVSTSHLLDGPPQDPECCVAASAVW